MKPRKYTINYYLEFLEEQNTDSLKKDLQEYIDKVIPKINERYKRLKPGEFVDYVAHYEDFYMITTYQIENLEPIAFNIIRYKNGLKHQQYYCKCYKSYFSDETEWKRYKMNFCLKRYCYTGNLKEVLKGTEFEYSSVWELGNNIDIKIRNLLFYCNEKHIREIERLTKLKCYRLAKDVMNGNARFIDNNSNIIKAIGLSSWSQMQYAIEKDMNSDSVMAFINLLKSDIDFKCFDKFKSYFKYYSLPKFDNFSQKSFVQYYLNQIKAKLYKGTFKHFVKDYEDYIYFGRELGYDFNNTKYYKPQNFKIAHDQASLKYQSKKNKKLDSAVRKILKNYTTLVFEKGNYCVVVPKTADDIRLEGINMKNCVGGYVDRVAKGMSIICFIRHKEAPNKSFYTVELKPQTYEIVQCRGYHNETTPEEKQVQAFTRQWRKQVLSKLKIG